MFRRYRSDLNQSQIVKDLRAIGASVCVVSQYGIGFDLLVGYRGLNYLVEVKRDEKHHLTDNEKKLQEQWRGMYLVIKDIGGFLDSIRQPLTRVATGENAEVAVYFSISGQKINHWTYGDKQLNRVKAQKLFGKICKYKSIFKVLR